MSSQTITLAVTTTKVSEDATPKTLRSPGTGLLGQISSLWTVFWLLTKDDFATFVLPNTTFGLFGALSGLFFVPSSPASTTTSFEILSRVPLVILFNWSNLLIFDLANQRLPASFAEDRLNKPWRPGPSGLVTPIQLRRTLLVCIPAVVTAHYWLMGTGPETTALVVLTWLYNDLAGGDEHWALRNVIIAAAFGLYNFGSLKVAAGADCEVTDQGLSWVLLVSGVILTTMHVQDLKDQAGDRARDRRSAPLVIGDRACRWTISVPILFWSLVCPWYWGASLMSVAACWTTLLGLYVAAGCLLSSGKAADRRTWELWALWTVSLYALPWLVSTMTLG